MLWAIACTGCLLNRPSFTIPRFCLDRPWSDLFHAAKLQLFHKPARGLRKFYYNELSLVVCFTRIAINVPRIVINCFGGIASGCGWLQQPCHASRFFSLTEKTRTMPKPFGCFGWVRLEIVLGGFSSHVMPAQACAVEGIYGCGILESARLNIKSRHCISGCGGVVLSGL